MHKFAQLSPFAIKSRASFLTAAARFSPKKVVWERLNFAISPLHLQLQFNHRKRDIRSATYRADTLGHILVVFWLISVLVCLRISWTITKICPKVSALATYHSEFRQSSLLAFTDSWLPFVDGRSLTGRIRVVTCWRWWRRPRRAMTDGQCEPVDLEPHPTHPHWRAGGAPVQNGYIGFNTGNGEKLSNSQACCLAQLCMAAA